MTVNLSFVRVPHAVWSSNLSPRHVRRPSCCAVPPSHLVAHILCSAQRVQDMSRQYRFRLDLRQRRRHFGICQGGLCFHPSTLSANLGPLSREKCATALLIFYPPLYFPFSIQSPSSSSQYEYPEQEAVNQAFTGTHHGVDRKGRPVTYELPGRYDTGQV